MNESDVASSNERSGASARRGESDGDDCNKRRQHHTNRNQDDNDGRKCDVLRRMSKTQLNF